MTVLVSELSYPTAIPSVLSEIVFPVIVAEVPPAKNVVTEIPAEVEPSLKATPRQLDMILLVIVATDPPSTVTA